MTGFADKSIVAELKKMEAERDPVRDILIGTDLSSLPKEATTEWIAQERMAELRKLRFELSIYQSVRP